MERNLPKNPYPGLRPFEYAENRLFFGREGQSEEVLLRLQISHFLAVVGSSGSGKSSLVRAGLLPMLHVGFMADAGARWRIAIFRPGDNPIHNLATALVKPTDFAASSAALSTDSGKEEENLKIAVTETILRRSAVGLRDYAKSGEFAANENLIVIVDQFEEIFRFKKDSQIQNGTEKSKTQDKAENEAAAFVKLLLEATSDKTNRVYVVITMRSDFLGNCAEFYNLPEAINNGQYLIPRLTRSQLRQVIESPAKVQGVQMSPVLVTRLLNDIGDDQDQLPILQHALMRTWDEWAKEASGEINLEHYERTGGMDKALSNHADEAFLELGGNSNSEERLKQQKIAEKLFKCLTEIDQENRETRRATTLDKICIIAGAELQEVIPVIDVFRGAGRTFLMPPPDVTLDENLMIDISHESLIRKWTRLKKWVEDEAQQVQTYRRFAQDAKLNTQKKKGLLSEPELSEAVNWLEIFNPNEIWAQLNYKTGDQRFLSNYVETVKYLEENREHRKKQSEEEKIAEEKRQQKEELERERKLREEVERELERKRRVEEERKELTKQVEDLAVKQESENPKNLAAPYISEAKDVLRGKQLLPDELLTLAKKLKNVKAFNYARRILARAASDAKLAQAKELRLKIYQQWALCTYKDSDLPADSRLDKALNILRQVEDIDTTKNQETLGLIGAIWKRKWEVDNQKLQLERSLLYYERGYREGTTNDQGWNGINAAFVLDLLAYQEEDEAKKAKTTSMTATERKVEARLIRENIVKTVAPLADKPETGWLAGEWWFYSTIAEAYFGLKEYDKAVEWLMRGREKIGRIPDWEIESTTNQLARLAILQSDSSLSGSEFQDTPAWNALQQFFGTNAAAVRSAFIGKIGLALSGGGFRASLFHIGTLAKLAELDVLRQVEVLSCVSGGSIIGAHYYLEVRRLLQSKPDGEITKEDYLNIVSRVEKDFLAGVQRNVRMRIAADPITNIKMIFSSAYSRSMRAGELYEEEIFSRVGDGEGEKIRYLNQLNIFPKDETNDFAPKLHNWRRTAKAPILILNATTLNTGHNWQFTTSWMGEPPSSIDTEVDTNDQLRRMYYTEAPEEHRSIRLGHAVSASACVPGIFEPLSLENLYPDRIVRLADGGGSDNQGLSGLLEQDCTVVLISDGSGQMESESVPSNGPLGVLLRSSSILMSRVRDVQYHDLERRKRSSLLRGLMFIHLKEDLDADPVDWVNCLDPFAGSIDARPPARQGILTRYGIAKEIQTRLAAVRTDLDSFSDIEAYALMTSAYRMTEDAFVNGKCVEGFSYSGEPVEWDFLKVEEAMKGTGRKYEDVKNLLDTSSSMAFKIWKQSPSLKYAAWFLGATIIALIVWWCISYSELVIVESITLGALGKWILRLIVTFAIAYFFGWLVRVLKWRQSSSGRTLIFAKNLAGKVVKWRESLYRVAFGVAMSIFGWIVARVHLHVFDRMFLKRGSLDYFRRRD